MSWPDDHWVPPWTPGLPQKRCATCRSLVVAVTLDGVGDCRNCACKKPWRWEDNQLVLAVAA